MLVSRQQIGFTEGSMRLSVMIGTQEQYDAAIDAPSDGQDIREYYLDQLARAEADTIDFKALPAQDTQSALFGLMNLKEGAIIEYFREHDKPSSARIICTDEDTAKLYKVVYNYFYADSKPNRMEDDSWD